MISMKPTPIYNLGLALSDDGAAIHAVVSRDDIDHITVVLSQVIPMSAIQAGAGVVATSEPDEFPEVWTCRDGRKLKVSEMDEHHVRAALNMVIRRSRKRQAIRLIIADMRAKHGIDDDWSHELNTSDSSTKGASQ